MLKVSIITVVLNNVDTIEDCLKSVLEQDYPSIEHIIVDGASTDGTIEIIQKYQDKIAKIISEPDQGLYDAMNKGIKLASGDIVGILNSDDTYFHNGVISSVVKQFESQNVDSVFADLIYVKGNDDQKVVRYYSSANWEPDKFAYGWMPAHPTFFVKRQCYENYGLFKIDYKIAADYEILTRFLAKYKITYKYIPDIFVKMRTGGISTKNLKSNWILNKEIIRSCAENGIKTNMFKVVSKYPTKIFQIIHKPKVTR